MVTASAKGKKKKSNGKRTKKKPVNLASNYNSKFIAYAKINATTSDTIQTVENEYTYEPIASHMYPVHDDDYHLNDQSVNLGNVSCGDFHLHSLCSDGKFKPREVITKAAENGVTFMSLTDHDTTEGVDEAIATAKELDVLVIPGVEISAEVQGGENLHILGYFCPGSDNIELETQLAKIRAGRHKRGKTMLQKLANMGIRLDWERVLAIAGEAAPGRPHVAQALVERGHVANIREAFKRYLHNDGPAYAVGEHFPPEEAIQLIERSGGVSVLAHPWCCKNPLTIVPQLAEMGIHGVEVYNDASKLDLYGSLAKESGLLKLGGSDFHGNDPKNEHSPGEIPFPKSKVQEFLDHAKTVWMPHLVDRLTAIAMKVKSIPQSKNGEVAVNGIPASISIWKEHEQIARQTLETIGLPKEHFRMETKGHYCTLSFITNM